MATRPDQPVLGTIASLESIASVYRTTCFAGAGRIQPQIAVPETRMASAITAYNTVLSRRLRPLTPGVDAATDGVTDGLSGAAERCLGADRKSTRLNSSHEWISYAVFCLKKK